MIITEELVRQAVALAAPSAKVILSAEGTTWGPQWVDGYVQVPGLNRPIEFVLGKKTDWNPEWGEQMDFREVALSKLKVAHRRGLPTSVVVATQPWLLEEGDYLYPGGATRYGITVATSGAKGRTDEGLAEIVLSNIVMLAMLETERRVEKDEMQI